MSGTFSRLPVCPHQACCTLLIRPLNDAQLLGTATYGPSFLRAQVPEACLCSVGCRRPGPRTAGPGGQCTAVSEGCSSLADGPQPHAWPTVSLFPNLKCLFLRFQVFDPRKIPSPYTDKKTGGPVDVGRDQGRSLFPSSRGRGTLRSVCLSFHHPSSGHSQPPTL